MAAFYPFLDGEQSHVGERSAGDYRLASFIGANGGDQLVPGPVLDTAAIDDIHMVLLLVGLQFEGMQAIRRRNGEVARFAWIGFEPVLKINPEIAFALHEPAARDFLLDLKNAAEMVKALSGDEGGGCLIEIIPPGGA